MAELKDAKERAQYLTFAVAQEEYGLGVLKVREILEYDTVTRVPRTPGFVKGVINLRGRVVPVIDLAVRFGLPPSEVTKRTCVVIVEVVREGEPLVLGLLADAVSQVVELGADDIEPPPSFGTHADVAFLAGMGRATKGFILLLDIDRVLATGEVREMAALGDGSPALEGPRPEPEADRKPGAIVAAALGLLLSLGLGARPTQAQDPIQDNSFLIEEAYNQERGVVQHISAFARAEGSGDWLYTFTQEWPIRSVKHQLSYTLPVQELHSAAAAAAGLGDLALNYRYQAAGDGGSRLAFAPRVSLLVPTGHARESLGTGGLGLQMNLPVSLGLGPRVVTHWNAGATHTFGARNEAGAEAGTSALLLGQSVVWLAHPKLNLLVETVFSRTQAVTGPGQTTASNDLLVSPGVRFAIDFANGLQVVPGAAFTFGVGPSRGERGVFLYLSLEHAFRRSQ